jgi:hypothetical protein
LIFGNGENPGAERLINHSIHMLGMCQGAKASVLAILSTRRLAVSARALGATALSSLLENFGISADHSRRKTIN